MDIGAPYSALFWRRFGRISNQFPETAKKRRSSVYYIDTILQCINRAGGKVPEGRSNPYFA